MRIARILLVVIAIYCIDNSPSIASGFGPQLHKPSNVGKEFYITFPPCYEESGNNKLMLYISATADGTGIVEVADKQFKTIVQLNANEVLPIELGPGNGQAFSKPINGGIPPEQVYPRAAIHIVSTVPCIVYGVTRFSYTADSFLALPVESLGTSYVCASYPDMSWMYTGLSLPSEVCVVAVHDSTTVNFTLGGPAITKTSGGLTSGQTKRFTMNKGDVWVVGNDRDSKGGDLTGSVISADKPVAVFGGNQCANVPTTVQWCDYISEQLQPMEQWGYHYLIPKYATRVWGYYERVFAGTNHCELLRNGLAWKTLTSIGGQQDAGWTDERVDQNNYVVSLQSAAPFAVMVYNPGQSEDNVSTDPFQMNVLPWEQFSTSYILSTPGTKGGINFTRNYLGVIFPLNLDSTMPSDLEFGMSVNGAIVWQSLGSKFGPAFSKNDVYADRMPNGSIYAFKECILATDGVYALRCSKPFMAYTYGGSDYDSYGSPAGSLCLDFTHPQDKEAPKTRYTLKGGTYNCSSLDYPLYATVRSNIAKIVLDDSSSNFALHVPYFNPVVTSTLDWSIQAIDSTKEASARVIVVDRAGNDTTLSFHYIPIVLPEILSLNGNAVCYEDTVSLTCTNSQSFKHLMWSTGDTTKNIQILASSIVKTPIGLRAITASNDTVDALPLSILVHQTPGKPGLILVVNIVYVDTLGKGYRSFQWYLNGVKLIGDTLSWLKIDSLADTILWQVRIYDRNGCTTISDPIHRSRIIGTVSESSKVIELLPNPASSLCTVYYADYTPLSLDIYDERGLLLRHYSSAQLPENSLDISLQSFSSGVYSVLLHYAREVRTLKLVKE